MPGLHFGSLFCFPYFLLMVQSGTSNKIEEGECFQHMAHGVLIKSNWAPFGRANSPSTQARSSILYCIQDIISKF